MIIIVNLISKVAKVIIVRFTILTIVIQNINIDFILPIIVIILLIDTIYYQ